TLMAAIAVRVAVQEACALKADIKWPNDLLADGLKLCGILAETVETPAGRAAVVGIGINLNDHALPPELRAQATSIQAATGATPEIKALLGALLPQLARRYAQLHAEGGEADITRAWADASSYAAGKLVRVALGAEENIEGVTRGLEPDGALRVETEAGEIKIVRAGDVIAVRQMNNAE
ncbi:MAG: biotin--[acetyl-CoA-carboxylase] ligase, partial [Pyrinomonadaceae bacterium]